VVSKSRPGTEILRVSVIFSGGGTASKLAGADSLSLVLS
jgi:hypothetical protein